LQQKLDALRNHLDVKSRSDALVATLTDGGRNSSDDTSKE
jgi:hypothetical protein